MNATSFFYLIARDTIGDIDMIFLPSSNFMTLRQKEAGGDDGSVNSARDM
jgi:hypothetical protein